MSKASRALLVITDETLKQHSTDTPRRVMYVLYDDPAARLRNYQEVSECELRNALPGTYFQESALGISMFLPRETDLIHTGSVGGHSLSMHRLCFCYGRSFDDRPAEEYLPLTKQALEIARRRYELPARTVVSEFIMALFAGERCVRGLTQGRPITGETPCCDFFHDDVDGISHDIAGPIEAAFGLDQFHLKYALPCKEGCRPYISDPRFIEKYPIGLEGTREFTLNRFIGMIYDMLLIKYGMPIA